MSIRCLIIDDEPLAHEVILKYLKDIPFLELHGQCYRATDALDFLSKHEIDLIFLDIRMPKLNGLDFLRTLKYKPIIIITSAFEQYALDSFDLDVCDYLLKPFRFDRLLKAANRALEIYTLKKNAELNQQVTTEVIQADDNQISIKVDKKLVLVSVRDIVYLESLGNYVKVWQEKDFLLTPRTLSSFEDQLSKDIFIRIHKSNILNRNYIRYLEGNTIYLKNGTQLTVGKNYRQVIKQQLNK